MGFARTAFSGALLVLCACASVPMASAERDLAAKKFEVPPDEAHLYVYRDETFGAAIKLPVLVDGRHVGDTAPHTFLLVPVVAGPHVVVSKSEVDSELRFTAANGKAYFVWQEVKFGVFAARSELHLMKGKQGRAAVATCSLIEAPPGQLAAAVPVPGPSAAHPGAAGGRGRRGGFSPSALRRRDLRALCAQSDRRGEAGPPATLQASHAAGQRRGTDLFGLPGISRGRGDEDRSGSRLFPLDARVVSGLGLLSARPDRRRSLHAARRRSRAVDRVFGEPLSQAPATSAALSPASRNESRRRAAPPS